MCWPCRSGGGVRVGPRWWYQVGQGLRVGGPPSGVPRGVPRNDSDYDDNTYMTPQTSLITRPKNLHPLLVFVELRLDVLAGEKFVSCTVSDEHQEVAKNFIFIDLFALFLVPLVIIVTCYSQVILTSDWLFSIRLRTQAAV